MSNHISLRPIWQQKQKVSKRKCPACDKNHDPDLKAISSQTNKGKKQVPVQKQLVL